MSEWEGESKKFFCETIFDMALEGALGASFWCQILKKGWCTNFLEPYLLITFKDYFADYFKDYFADYGKEFYDLYLSCYLFFVIIKIRHFIWTCKILLYIFVIAITFKWPEQFWY